MEALHHYNHFLKCHAFYLDKNFWKCFNKYGALSGVHNIVRINLYSYFIVQNFGWESFGEFGVMNAICQYLNSKAVKCLNSPKFS